MNATHRVWARDGGAHTFNLDVRVRAHIWCKHANGSHSQWKSRSADDTVCKFMITRSVDIFSSMPFEFCGNIVRRAIGFYEIFSLCSHTNTHTDTDTECTATKFNWQRHFGGSAHWFSGSANANWFMHMNITFSYSVQNMWKMAASQMAPFRLRCNACDEWDDRKVLQIVLMSYFNWNGFPSEFNNVDEWNAKCKKDAIGGDCCWQLNPKNTQRISNISNFDADFWKSKETVTSIWFAVYELRGPCSNRAIN